MVNLCIFTIIYESLIMTILLFGKSNIELAIIAMENQRIQVYDNIPDSAT